VERMVDLQDIVMQEVGFREFSKLGNFWKWHFRNNTRNIYSHITHPLAWDVSSDDPTEDYFAFFLDMFDHGLVKQIKVNVQGRWEKPHKEDLRGKEGKAELQRLAYIAAQDYKKKNFLEFRLWSKGGKHHSSIEFAERNGKLVSNHVQVFHEHEQEFRTIVHDQRGYFINEGVWVPEHASKVVQIYEKYCGLDTNQPK
jgi:hypothetical protein